VKKAASVVLGIVASLVGLAALLVVAVVVLLQTGALNGAIESAVAAQVGRPVELEQAPSLGYEDGALTLSLGPLGVANADWATDQHADFARIRELRASLRLAPLLSGDVELPEVMIDAPQVHLTRNADGEANWPEGDDSADDGSKPWVPRIENLEIRNADVTYSDAVMGTDVRLALDQAKGRLGGGQELALQATGSLQDAPLELDVAGGELSELLDSDAVGNPVLVNATGGESTIRAQATSFANLDALEAEVEIDARQTLLDLLASLGVATDDLPPFELAAKVEPGPDGSLITADLSVEDATIHLDGRVDDLAAPLDGFAAEVSTEGDRLGPLLRLGGIEADGELPAYSLAASLSGGDEGYRIEGLDARLGENTITGEAAVNDLETLDGLEAKLDVDAPDLGPLLASFDLPYAEQVPSADIGVDITRAKDGTTAAVNGTIGGDSIALNGGYQGGITTFENPRLDLQMEGSALGALPAELGFAKRPIERYQIDAKVEERAGEASPVNLDITIEDTRVRFDGSVDELRALKGVDGQFQVQGPNPADILDLFKMPSVSLPPYDFAGHVTWRGDDIKVADLDGTFGESDARGSLAVDLRPAPPALTADLGSDRLAMDDLAGVMGSPVNEEERKAARERDRLLPTGEIDPEAWKNLDLDVRYSATEIKSTYLPIDRIEAHVVSKQGWLTIDPARTGLADGVITVFASLDGTQQPVAGEVDIRLEGLQLQDMLAKVGVAGEGLGTIDGRIRLEGKGRSIEELLGTADGQSVLTMTGGSIDALILEAVGLDVAEALAVLFDSADQAEDDKVPIRCAIVNLDLKGGVATTRPIVLDTEDSKIVVDGTINLDQETLDIFIESLPKDPSLFSANQPIHVDGALASPSVNPAPNKVENEALGWLLAPLAAVAPFFDLGGEEDSPCASLLADAKDAAATKPD